MATNAMLNERVLAVKAAIVDLEFKLAVQKAVLAELESIPGRGAARNQQGPANRKRQPTSAVRPGSLAEMALNILKKQCKPMAADAIAAEIEKSGFKSGGVTGVKPLVVSAMSRSTLFKKASRGVYALSEWPEEQPKDLPLKT